MEVKSTKVRLRKHRLGKVTKITEYDKNDNIVDILENVSRMESIGYHIEKIDKLTEHDNTVIHFAKYVK
jgi:hypothetical protein